MDQSVIEAVSERAELIALFVLVAGVLVAAAVRRLVRQLLRAMDRWLAQQSTASSDVLSPALSKGIERASFWLVIVVAVVLALRALGVGGFSTLLQDVTGYVPRLVIAIAIVGGGHLIGILARELVARLSDSMHTNDLLPRLVHGTTVLVAVVMAVQQLQIDISFVTQLLLVLLGIGSGGLALAFALGARQHVANLIARSELKRFSVGERIRVDGQEGTVVEIRQTGLDLLTTEGVASIPASRFAAIVVLRVVEGEPRG